MKPSYIARVITSVINRNFIEIHFLCQKHIKQWNQILVWFELLIPKPKLKFSQKIKTMQNIVTTKIKLMSNLLKEANLLRGHLPVAATFLGSLEPDYCAMNLY